MISPVAPSAGATGSEAGHSKSVTAPVGLNPTAASFIRLLMDMGEPVKIIELARSMIRLHGMIPYLETDAAERNGDMRINFSGLRPGEKLHEELLVGSDVSATDHPRIMCADESKLEFDQLQKLLASLVDACDEMNVTSINSLMKDAAVGFRPTGAVTDLLCPASEPVAPAEGATGEIIDIKKKRKRK